MGLASKLAASQNAAQGGFPPQGGQQQGGYPGQPQYQAYPGGAPGAGAPGQPGQPPPGQYGQQQQYGGPPGQYGGPPPQQQFGGGAPPPVQAGPAEIQGYKQLLISCIQEKQLQAFYPPNSPIIDQIAQKAPALINQVIQRWKVAKEIANDVVKLALYDIVLYIDDSGSMQFEEEGSRIKDLRLILERVAFAATLFDPDGISVRFMNNEIRGDNISSEDHINRLMHDVKFKGLTPMGTKLREKVIDPIVLQQARGGSFKKPVLVITITDGQPAGEPQNAVFEVINYAFSELGKIQSPGGRPGELRGGLAFEFAQVGNDEMARKFLGKLDEDPAVGPMVDCTSNFESEQEEMMRANPPVDLTPDLWIVKLLLGAIDSSYDAQDEKSNPRPGGFGGPGGPGGYPPQGGPQGGYGGPPPGQYGQPPQGYGQQQYPPQQGGGQYGGPPPGQYPPQQGGQYGGPPSGQYGQRPPQGGPSGPGGYPNQQQYGGPPPPGRY